MKRSPRRHAPRRPSATSSARWLAPFLVVALSASCASQDLVRPTPAEPFVTCLIVIGDRAPFGWLSRAALGTASARAGTSGMLLDTTASLSIRRDADGRALGFVRVQGPISPLESMFPDAWNWALTDSTVGDLLGADSLSPGNTLTLEARFADRIIRGNVTIPSPPRVVVRLGVDRDTLIWSAQEPGAQFAGPDGFITRDSTAIVPRDRLVNGVTIVRVDPQLARALSDPRETRVGMGGALGILGAAAVTLVRIDPDTIPPR